MSKRVWSIFVFVIVHWVSNAQDITDGEAREWHRQRNSFKTNLLKDTQFAHLQGMPISLFPPIVIAKVQHTYDSSAIDLENTNLADSLTRAAVLAVFGNEIKVTNLNSSIGEYNRVSKIVTKALRDFKTTAITSYKLDSTVLPKISSGYLLIPYLEWVKTTVDFAPDKKRNVFLGKSTDYTGYLWTSAHAFVFLVDPRNGKLIFFVYEAWANGTPIDPSLPRLVKLFGKCAKKYHKLKS